MQRDSYAILIKKKGKPTIDILIEQVSKEVTKEKIFDEVFDGYDARRIILMTHMAKSQPPAAVKGGGELLAKDVIVPNWEALQKIHKPNYMYRLLPLVCSTPETFCALMGICQTPHSPFTIDDRKDHVAYRQKFYERGAANAKAVVDRFFTRRSVELSVVANDRGIPVELLSPPRPPIQHVDFDGVLISKDQKSIGFVRTVPVITPEKVHHLADTVDLILSPDYKEIAVNGRHADEFSRFGQKFTFLAGEQPILSPAVRKNCLDIAGARKVILYHKNDKGVYQYITP
jgi:hypothetical protein